MAKQTIIFDLDGTLLDTADCIIHAAWKALLKNNIPVPNSEEDIKKNISKICAGKGSEVILNALLKEYLLTTIEAEKFDEIKKAFFRCYRENITLGVVLYPNVIGALKGLLSKGWKLAVCTNKIHDDAISVLGEMGILRYFDKVLGATPDIKTKPDPEGIFYIMESIESDPKKTIFVGDTKVDSKAAKNANIPFIFVNFGYSELSDAKDFPPERSISSFIDLENCIESITQ